MNEINKQIDTLLGAIVRVFNSILKPEPMVTAARRESMVRVLYKKGDSKQPDNYRHIISLSILYKLF